MKRAIVVLALLHVALALLLFAAGRTRIGARAVDENGIVIAAARDSYVYQAAAIDLTQTLRQQGAGAWLRAEAPLHVRLFSLCFAVLGPVVGASTLAAEPVNLACYLAIVLLAFAIGREIGGATTARIAAGVVALWPTFVFHTLQLLKDPLFIAGALAVVFVVVTWLTAEYDRRRAAAAALAALVATAVLLVIRPKFAIVLVALAAFGLAMLVVRQIAEKRFLKWNVSAAAAMLVIAALPVWLASRAVERVKLNPSPVRGEAKTAAGGVPIATIAVWRTAASSRASAALGSARRKYNLSDRNGGSGVDATIELHSAGDVLRYTPRAFAIGMWAPFPSQWLEPGQTVGRAGRAISGIETLAIYACELLAVAAVFAGRRRLASLLLLGIAMFGVTLLALVVSNLGTLYRFRLSFWILLIVAATAALPSRVARTSVRAPRPILVLLALLAASCHAAPPDHDTRITVTNLTGTKIRALYLSPAGAATWEENVLGGTPLRDGESVRIRFRGQRPNGLWDLRADGGGGRRAVWNGLDVANVSSIDLRIDRNAAVAELAR